MLRTSLLSTPFRIAAAAIAACLVLPFAMTSPLSSLAVDDVAAKRAPGFFSVRKEPDGKWWIISPEGKRFISKGVCTAGYWQDFIRGTTRSPYNEACQAKYGSQPAWRTAAARRMMGWNFNSLGAWADDALAKVEPEGGGARLTRSPILNMGSRWVKELAMRRSASADAWLHGIFPDVFDPGFADFCKKIANEDCTPHAEDKGVLGWFSDNELRWGPDWRSKDDILLSFLNMQPDTAGRKAAAEYLEKAYKSDIAEFNKIWKSSFADWKAVATNTTVLKSPYPRKEVYMQNKDSEEKANTEEPGRARYVADCEGFMPLLAERYFKATTEAIRAAAPNHMVFGCRFAYVPSKPVVDSAAHWLDIVSFNAYSLDPTSSVERYAAFGRPLIIGEFSFRGKDSGLPNSKGAGPVVQTQADRARCYQNYVYYLMAHPQVVGYHWFEHADEPKEGRFDGEDSNYGLVNIKDEPYEEFVRVVQDVNSKAEAWHQSPPPKEEIVKN
ncbi:agarase [Verrucomicrobia bacterium LW23]|nr:agarase [Verrucomicrobia bacterium LW23]